MQFGKQWNVSSALHSHHTPTRRVAMCNNNNKHCYEALDHGLKQRFYAMCHPLYYLPPYRPWGARSRSRHLRRARSVPPRAHPWGSRGPATGRSTSPCPPAPRPAHTGAYYLVLSVVCAQLWIQYSSFLRDNGLIRILLLHLPNLLGSLLTYATLQRYSLQYFTAAHNHNVCVTQTTNTQRCVVSGCVSTIKHIFSPIVLSIPNSGTRIYVYFFQFLAATRNFVAKVFSGNV